MNTEPETYSLLGKPLYAAAAVPAERRAELEAARDETRAELEAAPDDVAAIHAHAKSLAALHEFRAAVALLSDAIERLPESDRAMLYCDRGHYRVNLREFELAEADLLQATSEDEFEVWYHLALARWFSGKFEEALETFRRCYAITEGDSHRAAITDWLYMCLNRLGRSEEAAPLLEDIHPDMEMTGNNHLYLKQLLFYKGEFSEQEMEVLCAQGGLALTNNFTMGCWYLARGDESRAKQLFQRVVDEGTVWGAFGQIGAEAELARAR